LAAFLQQSGVIKGALPPVSSYALELPI